MLDHVALGCQPAREVNDDLAILGNAVNVWPTGERQPKYSRHLVERLPRSIVDRCAKRTNITRHIRDK